MIDRKWIGREIGRSVLPIEAGRLRFFAKAIGEDDPVYFDEAAAKAAGYAGLLAPPTFLFAAELDSGAAFRMLDEMGVPLGRILHGEQGFEYFLPAIAGDVISVRSTVKDIYEKKGGALEFIELHSEARNSAGELVARMRSVTVVRH
jgi:acyl dehydratase